MIKRSVARRQRPALRVDQSQARCVLHHANARDGRGAGLGGCCDIATALGGGCEGEFVIVAAGQCALAQIFSIRLAICACQISANSY